MTNSEMTSREEYVAGLKRRLARCNAAIARVPAGGAADPVLRAQRDDLLGRVRAFEAPAVSGDAKAAPTSGAREPRR